MAKKQIKYILVWDWEVQTKNCNNEFILTDERIYIYIYIYYIYIYIYIYMYNINHTTSIRHQKVHLTYIENRPAFAWHVETKGNYKHQQ